MSAPDFVTATAETLALHSWYPGYRECVCGYDIGNNVDRYRRHLAQALADEYGYTTEENWSIPKSWFGEPPYLPNRRFVSKWRADR